MKMNLLAAMQQGVKLNFELIFLVNKESKRSEFFGYSVVSMKRMFFIQVDNNVMSFKIAKGRELSSD